MSDKPNVPTVTLFGNEYELELTAADFRIAELQGEPFNLTELQGATDFSLGCRLAYLSIGYKLPDEKGEEEMMMELAESGKAEEVAGKMVDQFYRAQDELGKFLSDETRQMINQGG